MDTRTECLKLKVREYNRRYYFNHKEQCNKRNRLWKVNNPERMREYRLNYKIHNPWVKNLEAARQRCRPKGVYFKRGIKCLLTVAQIKEIWFRDKAFEMAQPSLDRLKSEGDYVITNVRFIELTENKRRSRISQSIEHLYAECLC